MIIAVFVTALASSCNGTKKDSAENLFGHTWELEYLSGPRIAFDGLFTMKKPQITFNKENQKVEGNSGCNGYSAAYTLDETAISFGDPGPTTMMYCGEGESHFLNAMEKVNRFAIDKDGKLNLMIDDVPMLRFKKVEVQK